MTCNVGGTDRAIRAGLGVLFLLAGLFLEVDVVWRVVLLVLAGIGLGTALTRYCPLNQAIGVDTCRDRPAA